MIFMILSHLPKWGQLFICKVYRNVKKGKCSFKNSCSGFPVMNIAKENFSIMYLRIRTRNGVGKTQLFALCESALAVQAPFGSFAFFSFFQPWGPLMTSASPQKKHLWWPLLFNIKCQQVVGHAMLRHCSVSSGFR